MCVCVCIHIYVYVCVYIYIYYILSVPILLYYFHKSQLIPNIERDKFCFSMPLLELVGGD